jgi:LuxR family transcriptional regulator, activator of conjugal transfer of Ti plasmids
MGEVAVEKRLGAMLDLLDSAQDGNMIKSALRVAAHVWGYECFAYLQTEGADITTFNTYPKEFERIYITNRYSRVDPVVWEAKQRRELFWWTADEWQDRGASTLRTFREHAVSYGIRSGLTIPVEGSYCSTIMLTFASSKKEADHPKALDPLHALQLALAVHYRLKLVGAKRTSAPRRAFSSRENICVKWAEKGKTTLETSMLTGINARTVQHHLDSARKKLNAKTIAQLISIAKDRGLI